ncbi:MAG: lipopolysaccharide biosynthesis protein [Saprospiraceae bacterium]|nr:lipopolysaccharide biosynthesis protein [Saprospiraceae bacterium]
MNPSSTISALKWNIADQSINQAIGFVVNLWLLRLLEPEIFGLYAIPFVLFTLLRTLQDMGTTHIFFTAKATDYPLARVVFGFVLVCSAVFVIPAWVWGKSFILFFGGSERAMGILNALLICFLMSGFGMTQESMLRKTMQFRTLFFINTTATLISSIIGLYLAFRGHALASLIWKALIFTAICNGGFYIYTSQLKRPSFDFRSLKSHLGFTLPMVVDQFSSFLSRNVDSLFVGRFLGMEALGIYDRAYKFLTLPMQQVGGTVAKVLLPSLSNRSDDDLKNELMLKSIGMSTMVIAPLMFGLAVLATEFTEIIMTEKWLGMVPLLIVFSLLACFQSVSILMANLFIVKGKSRTMMIFGLITKGIYLLIFYYTTAVLGNLNALVYWYACASVLSTFIFWYLSGKSSGLKLKAVVTVFLEVMFPAVLMAVLIYFLKSTVLPVSSIWSLLVLTLLGASFYFGYLKIFAHPYLDELGRIIKTGTKAGENRI